MKDERYLQMLDKMTKKGLILEVKFQDGMRQKLRRKVSRLKAANENKDRAIDELRRRIAVLTQKNREAMERGREAADLLAQTTAALKASDRAVAAFASVSTINNPRPLIQRVDD